MIPYNLCLQNIALCLAMRDRQKRSLLKRTRYTYYTQSQRQMVNLHGQQKVGRVGGGGARDLLQELQKKGELEEETKHYI